MKIFSMIKLPDLVTLGNAVSGLTSMYFSVTGNYFYAAYAMILAIAFDYSDGKVARLLKKGGKLGKDIDSLADGISFGAAPAVLIFSMFRTPLSFFFGALVMSCGILRLARFNVIEFKGYYVGVPIPFTAVIFPILVFLKVGFPEFAVASVVISYLMISDHQVKKAI